MKKKSFKLMVCAAIMVLSLSVTACGSSKKTLEDYFNEPSAEAMMDSMLSSMSGDGISADIEVKGNEFTVIIQFEDSSVITDDLADILEQGLEAQADTIQSQIADFDAAIEQEGACTVVYRYTDPDGNVIVEKSYSSK